MTQPYLSAETLDDLMRKVIQFIEHSGVAIQPSKGPAREVTGVLLELLNPRARLSRSETRGKPFSCLGELCWYLAGNNELKFIKYYLRDYEQYADGAIIHGGYGPRLRAWNGTDQLEAVVEILLRKPHSRQAVIQLFAYADIQDNHKDVPCTCTLQFMIRGNKLHMFTHMRSNDVYRGLPHDIFSFTMIQELLAARLLVGLGSYKHFVGSLHIYKRDEGRTEEYIGEGWQSRLSMPEMPLIDPRPAIHNLLDAESQIRHSGECTNDIFDRLDPYWGDLLRLLQVFRYKKERRTEQISQVKTRMDSDFYNIYIDTLIHLLK